MTLDKWIQWEVIYLTRYKLKFRSDTSSPLDIQVTWMVLIYERERCHIDELNASLHRYRVRYHDRTHHPTKIDLPRDPPFTCRNTVATVKCGRELARIGHHHLVRHLFDKTRLEIRLLGRNKVWLDNI